MQQPKGQSAIEYLATYGWMLLVVAIVGGSIFTTVQNSADIQSVSGLNNAEVRVSNYGLSEDGLQFSLRSAAAEQVNIRKIIVTDPETGVSADISPSKVVAIGDTANFKLKDVQRTDTSDTYDLEFTYDVGGLTGKVAGGKIKGRFGVFNRISLENADFNRSTNKLQIDVKNTGDNTTESINYTVEANNSEYTGSLSNLNSDEKAQINISTDETYPLESVNLDTEGHQFIDTNSGLSCTPTKGLVGYWTFNQEQSMNDQTLDLSGLDNNGSLENGANITDKAVVDDGTTFGPRNRGRVEISDHNSLDPKNQMTVATWTRSRNFTDPKPQVFVDKGGEYFNRGYAMRFHGWGPGLRWNVGNGTDSCGTSPWGRNIERSTWYHSVGTFDNGEIKMYRNANLIDRKSCGFSQIKDTDYDLSLGRRTDWRYGYLNGTIDETRIYNRSLSRQEIERLYNVRSEDWAVSGCKLTG